MRQKRGERTDTNKDLRKDLNPGKTGHHRNKIHDKYRSDKIVPVRKYLRKVPLSF
jgi:hypothetical protein